MNLKLTTIYIDNLEISVDFYQNILARKEVKRLTSHPDANIVFFKEKEGGIIELIKGEEQIKEEKQSGGFPRIYGRKYGQYP